MAIIRAPVRIVRFQLVSDDRGRNGWGEIMRLKDKVAIITGSAHGMGEVEARLFAEEGAKVVIADVLAKEGEVVAAEISAGQRQARFVRTDVTSESDWQRLIAETIAAYGRLDILVNNAGISGSAVGDADGSGGLAAAARGEFDKCISWHQASGRGDGESWRWVDRQHLIDYGHRRQ